MGKRVLREPNKQHPSSPPKFRINSEIDLGDRWPLTSGEAGWWECGLHWGSCGSPKPVSQKYSSITMPEQLQAFPCSEETAEWDKGWAVPFKFTNHVIHFSFPGEEWVRNCGKAKKDALMKSPQQEGRGWGWHECVLLSGRIQKLSTYWFLSEPGNLVWQLPILLFDSLPCMATGTSSYLKSCYAQPRSL